jgi:hypothetical protein
MARPNRGCAELQIPAGAPALPILRPREWPTPRIVVAILYLPRSDLQRIYIATMYSKMT